MTTVEESPSKRMKARYSGGPHGVGDPDDKSLRRVELDVMIPKKMRDKAKEEKCTEEVKRFSECCKNSSVFMVVACRKENAELKSCLTQWYNNDEFRESCKKEYLDERTEFRKTGIRSKEKQRWPSNM